MLRLSLRMRKLFRVPGRKGKAFPHCAAAKPLPVPNRHSNLIELTLRGLLVRTPSQKLCSMTKAAAGEVIVLNFDDEFRGERLPFCGSLSRPTARTAGSVASEARRLDQFFQLLSQRRFF